VTHTGEGQFGRNLNISECRTQANRCHTSHDKKNPAAHTPINSNPLYFFLKLQMAEKDSPFRLAPPTSAPSMSGHAISSSTFSALTEPPY